MNLFSRLFSGTVLLLVGLLTGCAASGEQSANHSQSNMGMMDMQSMCEMHKKMMGGKPTAEQQAMMNEHMKSMSPEMRTRMQAMHEKCEAS